MHELAPIRQRLDAQGLMAKKAFGQHFLLDLNITRKIVRLGGDFKDQVVIEVGPGPGGLTQAILESSPKALFAIEKDSRFVEFLSDLIPFYPNLQIISQDALKTDELSLTQDFGRAFHIISNLPYNVGTPLLIKWLTLPTLPQSMTLMFQREVAERIVAPVGDKAYGRLSVIAQAICDARIILDLPSQAFTPPPKVASAVVSLNPKASRLSAPLIRSLEAVTAAAFGQRRKMLRVSLKALGGEQLLQSIHIDPTARAEEIPPEKFIELAEYIQKKN